MWLATSACLVAAGAAAQALGYVESWEFPASAPAPRQAAWASYYRDHANPRMGAEHTLPNGIVWRLQTDMVTGLSFPRLTSMSNSQSLQAANRLLETAHGGVLLTAAAQQEFRRKLDRSRESDGRTVPSTKELVEQSDVALTYASDQLVSVVDLEVIATEGSAAGRVIRGLIFDLASGHIHHVGPCPGSSAPYGPNPTDGAGNYQFQLGELLRVCDGKSYEDFVRLLQSHAQRAAQAAAGSDDLMVKNCIHQYVGNPDNIGRNLPLVLYLTFEGLAVMNTTFWPNAANNVCASKRSAINPVVIPYAELATFMMPGPWRDELMALPAPRR